MNMVLATFAVDPFVPMFLVGVALGLLFRWRRLPIPTPRLRYRWALGWMAIFAVGFFAAAEIPCYFDLMAQPAFSTTETCNEFMWHGYFDWPLTWLTGEPPIPTYTRWWSTPWLLMNGLLQITVGMLAVTLAFRIGRPKP